MHTQEVILTPEQAFDEQNVLGHIRQKIGLKAADNIRIYKRSIDARSKEIKVRMQVQVYGKEAMPDLISYNIDSLQRVSDKKKAVIIGAVVPGWVSLMSVLLFLGGLQCFMLGIIGEYIGRISHYHN